MSEHSTDMESIQSTLPLRIYLPQSLINSDSGFCYGKWMQENDLIFITEIRRKQSLIDQELIQSVYWENDFSDLVQRNNDHEVKARKESLYPLVIRQRIFNGVPSCRWRGSLTGRPSQDVIIIIFDEDNIRSDKTEAGLDLEGNISKNILHSDLNLLATHLRDSASFRSRSKVCQRSMFRDTLAWPFFLLVQPFLAILKLFLNFCSAVEERLRSSWLKTLPHVSASASQLAVNFRLLQCVVFPKRESSYTKPFRFCNILFILTFDLLLGCLVCFIFHKYHLHQLISEIIVVRLKSTGDQLQHLLNWMMGAPAGLKLNSGFAHFLGHFFLYQSYLWIGYLHILYPIMNTIIRVMALSGCLGLSVLLAAAADIVSLLTFHIYCFYVYAAKIFTLQLSALSSLSRLFRGRKWNVLRNRVDSCSYDVDQLFIGTLMFTILLFLLPTSLLFYTVFASLQMVVLMIKGILHVVINFLNTFPWYTLVKWLMDSATLKDQISFTNLGGGDGYSYCLNLQLKAMPLPKAIKLTREYNGDNQNISWSELVKNLLRGEVIKPWNKGRKDAAEKKQV